MQRSSDGLGGVITDAASFGSSPLRPNHVASRIRQVAPFISRIPREILQVPHERYAVNPWAANPPNPHNRPFIMIRLSKQSSGDEWSGYEEGP